MSDPVVLSVGSGPTVEPSVGAAVALSVAEPAFESVAPAVVVVGNVDDVVASVTVDDSPFPVAESSSRPPLSPHAAIHNTPSEKPLHRMRRMGA
jgi:hypothetical protein